jgi:hypothetical protein
MTNNQTKIRPDRIAVIVAIAVISVFAFSYLSTGVLTGAWQYFPLLWITGLAIVAISKWRSIGKWIGIMSLFLLTTSCNYIPSDQIGVWVKNFGRNPTDYSIVYGKFPKDWTRSTWSLTFPGKPFSVGIDPIKVSSKDGVEITVDPSVLCELGKTNEDCRKYAFKMAAYKDNIEEGLSGAIFKECLDVVRSTINSANADSVMFNQTLFVNRAEDQLTTVLKSVYGVQLSQFSMSINFPSKIQEALNDRLSAEQETKKTLASLANEQALVKLEVVKAERAKVEQASLTPAMLRKMELDAMKEVYDKLSKSNNKVIIVGDPSKIILNN